MPVKLCAVVTYYDPGSGEFFVQDATGGTYDGGRHATVKVVNFPSLLAMLLSVHASGFRALVERRSTAAGS